MKQPFFLFLNGAQKLENKFARNKQVTSFK